MRKDSLDFSLWMVIAPLFIICFFVFGEHLIVVPLSADIAASTGIPPVWTGLLIAVYPIAAAVSAFISAPFSDRFGRKKMLLFLGSGFSVFSLCFAFSFDMRSAIGFRILSGVFGGPIFPNVLAFIGDSYRGRERAKIVTTVMVTFSVASVLAVPAGAWIGDTFGWRTPFYCISGSIVLCLLFLSRMKPVSTGADSVSVFRQYLEFFQLLGIRKVRIIFLLQFVLIVGLFGFVPNVGVWLSINYNLNSTQIGLCYMQGGIGGIIGNTLAGHLLSRGFKERLISAGSLLMGMFLFFATREIVPGMYIGAFFAGLMFSGAVRMPALQIILTELMPIHMRGRLMALSMVISNLTMGFGGIWSLPFLSMKGERLEGMPTVGLIGSLSLLLVPVLVGFLKKELDRSPETY